MSENMKAPLIPIFQLEEGFVSVQTESCDVEEMKREISKVPQHVTIPLTEEQKSFDPLNSNILPWQYVPFLSLEISLRGFKIWSAD